MDRWSTRLDRLNRCHQWHCSPHVDSCVVIEIILACHTWSHSAPARLQIGLSQHTVYISPLFHSLYPSSLFETRLVVSNILLYIDILCSIPDFYIGFLSNVGFCMLCVKTGFKSNTFQAKSSKIPFVPKHHQKPATVQCAEDFGMNIHSQYARYQHLPAAPPVTDCFKIAKTALPFALCER